MVSQNAVRTELNALPQLFSNADFDSLFALNIGSGQSSSSNSRPRPVKALPVVPTAASVSAAKKPAGELATLTAHSRAAASTPRKVGGVVALNSARLVAAEEGSQTELSIENARLRQELQSLREMYARHIAHTELKCEELMREKESECTNWFRNKKLDIKDMQAACVVMQALFEKKRRRLAAELEAERDNLNKKQEAFQKNVTQLEGARESDAKVFKERMDKVKSAHANELAELAEEKNGLASKTANLERLLDEARKEQDSLRETNRQKTQELERTKNRLAEVERNANVEQRDEKIRTLETELESLKQTFKERWKKEVESLQEEVMDYVRFIVHILPENWLETDAAHAVPADLRASVNRMQHLLPSGRSKPAQKARGVY